MLLLDLILCVGVLWCFICAALELVVRNVCSVRFTTTVSVHMFIVELMRIFVI